MVLFALSCFGLLLFLWLSFGGTVPFKAQGYRIRISFTNAAQLAQEADVRIAGVSVGKVIDKQLDPQGNRTIATIEMQRQYAPVHENARAILRLKTILGETYVELTPGTPNSPPLPDGGLLSRSNVIPAVQLDDVFNALDPQTRRAFQIWQQELARAVQGNGQNLNSVLGNLSQFAADATDITRVLDVEHAATVGLIQNGGTVFAALDQSQSALHNLITTAATTFATTAAQNQALGSTFQVFPTFLNETKATMARLMTFALDTDPLVRALNPVAVNLGPTLHSVRVLSPDLRNLFTNLGPLIRPVCRRYATCSTARRRCSVSWGRFWSSSTRCSAGWRCISRCCLTSSPSARPASRPRRPRSRVAAKATTCASSSRSGSRRCRSRTRGCRTTAATRTRRPRLPRAPDCSRTASCLRGTARTRARAGTDRSRHSPVWPRRFCPAIRRAGSRRRSAT
jgi:virulence factor Mce-like protein